MSRTIPARLIQYPGQGAPPILHRKSPLPAQELFFLIVGTMHPGAATLSIQQVLSAFAVSKLLFSEKNFGGMVLSYVATNQTTQLFALLAWQAWKKCVPSFWAILRVLYNT